MRRLVILGLLIPVLSGCTLRLGDFTMVSTRNVDLSRMGDYERGQRIEGEDIAHIILFVPTKMQPNIEDAIEDALDKVPGAVGLVDAVVRRFGWYFLYGQAGFVVEGTVLIDPAITGRVRPASS